MTERHHGPGRDEDGRASNPQERALEELSAAQYRQRERMVHYSLEVQGLPCVGGTCDEDDPCPLHAVTAAVAGLIVVELDTREEDKGDAEACSADVENHEVQGVCMIRRALRIAQYGDTDGAHHKMWVIDQMVRVLTGDRYEQWVAELKDGEDGPETYGWDEGVPP